MERMPRTRLQVWCVALNVLALPLYVAAACGLLLSTPAQSLVPFWAAVSIGAAIGVGTALSWWHSEKAGAIAQTAALLIVLAAVMRTRAATEVAWKDVRFGHLLDMALPILVVVAFAGSVAALLIFAVRLRRRK